jgi:propanediol dehydratase large subunit
MKNFKDFEKGGVVSVWIGNVADESQLDDYLNISRDFEKDFGFKLNDRNMPETVTETEATAIASLVGGFSWSDRYKDAVVAAAKRQGIDKANTMLVFLNFCYNPSVSVTGKTPIVRFLCAVPF